MRFHLKTAVAGALALAVIGGSLVSQAKKNSNSEMKMPGMDRKMTLEQRIPRAYDKNTVEESVKQAFVLDELPNGDLRTMPTKENLTEEEKARLKRTEEKTAPLYKEIDQLEAEVGKITDRILGEYTDGEERLNELYGRHDELWEKLDKHSTEEEWDMIAEDRIQASKSLSESEKDTLLRDLEDISALEAILEEKDREITEATAQLREEIDRIYDDIWALEKEDQDIWDRIYGAEPIPYTDGQSGTNEIAKP